MKRLLSAVLATTILLSPLAVEAASFSAPRVSIPVRISPPRISTPPRITSPKPATVVAPKSTPSYSAPRPATVAQPQPTNWFLWIVTFGLLGNEVQEETEKAAQ